VQHVADRVAVGDGLLGARARRVTEIRQVADGDRASLACCDPKRFVPGGRRQPRRQSFGLSDALAVFGEPQPDGLDDVVGGGAEAIAAGDRPHEPTEFADEFVPCPLVALDDSSEQLPDVHDVRH
jgi:hypothetical protein